MATQMFFGAETATAVRGTNSAKRDGSNSGWQPVNIVLARGASAADIGPTNTVAGPTSGVECATSGGLPYEWISDPLDANVTISGSITLNLWARENNMFANVAINAVIERLDSQGGIVSTIATTARTVELGTTTSAQNFTVTPTSTAMLKGDRLRIRVYGDDAGTMGTGRTFTFTVEGPTAGANGDSYVTFTENFGTLTTEPAGSKLWLTNDAGPAVGSAIEKIALLTGNASVQSIVVNTQTGWVAPIQWTDSGGGTVVEWYSRPLDAFTLSDLVSCETRASCTSSAANANVRVELAVCNGDGSGAVIWGAGNRTFLTGLGTSAEFARFRLSGVNVSVASGQRLRIRYYLDDLPGSPLVTGSTASLFYNQTNTTGDTSIVLTQTVVEQPEGAPVPRYPCVNHQNPGVLCKAHRAVRRWRHGAHGILVPEWAL